MIKRVYMIFLFVLALLIGISYGQSLNCPVLCKTCSASLLCSECYNDFQSGSLTSASNINQTCSVPQGFFQSSNIMSINITAKNYLYFCPIACKTCSNYSVCLSCIEGYNLSFGVCINNLTYQNNDGDWMASQFQIDLSEQKLNNSYSYGLQTIGEKNDSTTTASDSFTICQPLGIQKFWKSNGKLDFDTQVFRSYFGLPYHQWIQIRFQLIALDDWKDNSIILEINDRNSYDLKVLEGSAGVISKTFNNTKRRENLCLKSTFMDSLAVFSGKFEHTQSMAKIRITTSFYNQSLNSTLPPNAQNAYFGLREILVRIGTCKRNCLRCKSYDFCTACEDKYTLINGQCECDLSNGAFKTSYGCHAPCTAGTFHLPNGDSCLLCQLFLPGCKACRNQTVCLSCHEGSYLLNSTTCVTRCPNKYDQFIATTISSGALQGTCVSCPNGCKYCSAGKCLDCDEGYRKHSGTCVINCTDGYYPHEYTHNCVPCHSTCSKCKQAFFCSQCKKGLPSGVDYFLVGGVCLQKCQGFNYTELTSQITKEMSIFEFFLYFDCSNITCHPTCSHCFGTNSTNCRSCKGNNLLSVNYECVNQCPEGFYAQKDYCSPCPYFCPKCTQDSCLECDNGYFLFEGRCTLVCPSGFYPNGNQKKCLACDQDCAHCTGPDFCLVCKRKFLLHHGSCQKQISCNSSEYFDHRISGCTDCPLNCINCFRTLCYECDMGYYLDNGVCVQQCSSEKIKAFDRKCRWKSPLCQVHGAGDDPVCQKCTYLDQPLALQNNACQFQCSQGYKLNISTLTCVSCPSNCKSCQAETNFCIRCKDGYFVAVNGTCVQTNCPSKYMSDSIQCIKCPPNCLTCQADGSCQTCQNNYALNSTIKRCVDINCTSQPNSYYKATILSCYPCSSPCSTCTLSQTYCTSCIAGYVLVNQTCLISTFCPYKHFLDLKTGLCQPCKPQCQSCQNYSNCTTCRPGFYIFQGQCLSVCPSRTYRDKQSKKCLKCAPNCLECFGGRQTQCLKCHQLYKMDHTTCVPVCPLRKYADQTDHCDWCHDSCQKCWGPAQFQCEYCRSGNYLYRGFCYDICPAATFQISINTRICKECQWGCATCTSQSQCLQCFGGFYLYNGTCLNQCPSRHYYNYNTQICSACNSTNCSVCNPSGCVRCDYPFYRWDKKCVSSCPVGTYKSPYTLKQCLKCPQHCTECDGPFQCKSCQTGFKQFLGFCKDACSVGYYKKLTIFYENWFNQTSGLNQTINVTKMICNPCGTDCLTCLGSSGVCTRCKQSTYYLLKNGTCTKNCPAFHYKDSQSQRCIQCSPKCLKCDGYDKCTNCTSGYELIDGYCRNDPPSCPAKCAVCPDTTNCFFCQTPYVLYNFTCVQDCPTGLFKSGRFCRYCYPQCAQCSEKPFNCTRCQSGYYVFQNTCWQFCPSGYFANELGICKPCGGQNCLVCLNSTECQACQPKYALISGVCYKDCPKQSFYSEELGTCISCQQNCLTCFSDEICNECLPGFHLMNGDCVSNCPAGHFLTQLQTKVNADGTKVTSGTQCLPCTSPCLRCQNQATQCTSCHQGYSLNIDKCVKECPSGFYQQAETRQCTKCIAPCKTCTGNGTNCVTCPSFAYLHHNACVTVCPLGYYAFSEACLKCPPDCLSCQTTILNQTGSSNTSLYVKCQNCRNTKILFEGKCLDFCLSGTFNQSGICKPCTSPCKTCWGISVYECFTCQENFYYREGRCLANCPNGTFKDTLTQKCINCRSKCLQCSSLEVCTRCTSGFNLTQGYCSVPQPCTKSNCLKCQKSSSNNQTCIKCYYGYFLTMSGQCVKTCPSEYYAMQDVCLKCPSLNCLNCSVQNPNYCLKCKNYTMLSFGKCYQQCPYGTTLQYYWDSSESNNSTSNSTGSYAVRCKINPCLYNGTNNQCISCNSPYLLHQGKCIESCQNVSSYESQGLCLPCSPGCLRCDSQLICRQCSEYYYLFNQKCYRNCPIGSFLQRFGDQDSLICKSCPEGCLRCFSYASNTTNSTCAFKDCPICHQCVAGLLFNPVTSSCVSFCDAGLFLNVANKSCSACPVECATCSNSTYCYSCKSGNILGTSQNVSYYYSNGKCYKNCPVGTFLKNDIISCEPCPSNCQNCTNSTYCQSCKPGTYLQNNYCVQRCLPGYILFNGMCQPCNSNCKTCANDQQFCTSCFTNFSLQEGKCVNYCQKGTFADVSGQCRPCAPQCLNCSSYGVCTSCLGGFVLDSEGNCYQNCTSATMYYDPYNHACYKCSIDCQTCFGPNYDNCLSCPSNLVLYNRTCVTECPSGFFRKGFICQACDIINCQTCQNQVKNCTSCYIGYFLDPQTNRCVIDCPSKKYKDTFGICKPCAPSCPSCYGPSQNQCTSCPSGKIVDYLGNCLAACPSPNMYMANNICRPCPGQCSQCLSTGVCTVCKNGYKLNSDGTCAILCPAGTRPQSSNLTTAATTITHIICLNCSSGCAKCQSTDICLICFYPKTLKNGTCLDECPAGYINLNGKCQEQICQGYKFASSTANNPSCVAVCPDGYYPDANLVCQPCITGCKYCYNVNGCTQCTSPYIYLPSQGTCVFDCPLGYLKVSISYASTSTLSTQATASSRCVSCSSPCATCQNSIQQCSSCISGFVLYEKRCVTTCPAGQYLDSTNSKCYACNIQCKTCINSTNCTLCANPAYNPPFCNQTTSCSGATYVDSSGACKPCHSSCASCFGSTFTQCNSCLNPKVLFNGQCLTQCPSGYFKDPTNNFNVCTKCMTHCATCLNLSTCSTCKSGFLFYGTNCYQDCSVLNTATQKYSKDTSGTLCIPCPMNCSSCLATSTSQTECYYCEQPSFLHRGSCITSCPNGFFAVVSTVGVRTCQACSSNCLTCLNRPDSCTSCLTTNTTTYLFNDKCVQYCPIGFFNNNSTAICQACPVHCSTCLNASTCVHCVLPHLIGASGQCNQCLSGFFRDPVSGKCMECDSTCESCILSAKNCTSCSTILFNNTCVFQCPVGYYANQTKNCVSCQPNCLQCQTHNACSKCLNNYVLTINKTCQISCPTKQYSINGICYECPTRCATCINGNACASCEVDQVLVQGNCIKNCPQGTTLVGTNCQTCKSGCKLCPNGLTQCEACQQNLLRQADGSCIPKPNTCPDGKYRNGFDLCVQCHSSCLKCLSGTQCTECPQGSNLNNGVCQTVCRDGQYLVSGTTTCAYCHSSCKTCRGSTSLSCTSCPVGKSLRADGSCQVDCPAKTFLYNQNCIECPILCQACTSATRCQICQTGVPIFFNEMCYQTCPSGSYSNLKTCIACPTACQTCTSANVCTKCRYPNRLYNSSCIDRCPDGTYPAVNANECSNCSSQCSTCLSQSTCTSCKNNKVLFNVSCLNQCPTMYFPNSASQCNKCTSPCKQCSLTSTNCSSCITGYALLGNQCSNRCPDGKYMSANSTCLNCTVNKCKVCESYPICHQCMSGFSLYKDDQQCVNPCPNGYFNNASNGNRCESCQTNCKSCTSNLNCTICNDPLKLYQQNCVTNCPISTYTYTNGTISICIDCVTDCDYCDPSGDCTQCKTDYYLHQLSCVPQCPDLFFGNQSSFTCDACSQNCKKCLDFNTCTQCINPNYLLLNNSCVHVNCVNCKDCQNQTCLQCNNPYFLQNEGCVENCTDGAYGNTTLKKCQPCMRDCLKCPTVDYCQQCIADYLFTNQTGCVDEAFLQFGTLSNMSGFTSNITQITSSVYLATAIGPAAMGQMSSTYAIVQFNQILFAFRSQCKDNKQMLHFLTSLKNMALSVTGQSTQVTAAQRRRLQQTEQTTTSLPAQLSFLETNKFTFILIGVFLTVYVSVLIIQKTLPHCMQNCSRLHFYVNQVCQFIQKRFKWIYFDFILWISYIPFIFFALEQFKNFRFDTAEMAISCIFSIVVIATYPLYPLLICYIIKSNYTDLCLGTNTLTEMSLSPYVYKVHRPLQVPEEGQFRYFTKQNFRFIYYPLCYLRKFIFMLVLAFCPIPVATLGIIAGVQLIFIGYIVTLRPRQMPHLVADIIIQVVLFLIVIFIMIFLSIDSTRVTVMSIITQAVGFITANLSIVIGIILNLIAYYKIFMCIYDLIKHMKQKVEEKEKLDKIANGQISENEDRSDNNLINQKNLPSGMMKERKNDDSITQDDFQDQNKQDIYNMLNDKELIMNGVDPLRVTKNRQINKLEDFEDLPDMKLEGSGIHKKRAENRKNRRNKLEQKPVDNSPGGNSDDAMTDSLLSDAILIKDLKGQNKFKRDISNESKDHLLLEQGVLKDVTKDKYKRTDLAKIPSKHEAQDDFDDLDLSDRQRNNHNRDGKQVPEGKVRQMNINPKKMKQVQNLQRDDNINDGNLVDRNGHKRNKDILDIPVVEGKHKKRQSISDQQNKLQDLVGINKEGKNAAKKNQVEDINQGKFRERNAKAKQGEAFNQFDQLLTTNKGQKKIPDGNLNQRSTKLVSLQQEDEKDIQNANFKERAAKNKPVNNFFGGNDKQYENEGVMVDRQGKKKKNLNMVFQQQNEVEQVKMYENTGNKFKRNLGNQKQQDQTNIDAKTYDANAKKAQRTSKANPDEKGLQQGRFVEHQTSSRDRPQKNKYFDQTEDPMRQARTMELKTKKLQKEEKKGFFANLFNKQDEEEHTKIEEKKPKQVQKFQQSDMGRRRQKRNSRREQKKDTGLKQEGDLQQSYDDIVRKNKNNIIMPQAKKGKGFMSMLDQDESYQDSAYQRSPRKENDSRPRSRDRGLGVNDRGSDSEGEDTTMGIRKQRSSSKQRQRKLESKLHVSNNDDSSDVGDQQMSPQTRRKKKQEKRKRANKSGILQINGRDNGGDDDLDSIQL